MEQCGVVKVGDEIQGLGRCTWVVERVIRGRYGLLVVSGDGSWGFFPSELPPGDEQNYDWNGWRYRGPATINGQLTVGYVNFTRGTGPEPIEVYDAAWAKTLAEGQPEPMQSKPLPVAGNVTRMD